MRLTDLEPFFFRFTDGGLAKVESLAEAHAVHFLCPGCFRRNSGPVGTHAIHLPLAGRGLNHRFGTEWTVGEKSTGLADLTLTPSVLVHPTPITPETLAEFRDKLCKGWHGFITSGEVRSC